LGKGGTYLKAIRLARELSMYGAIILAGGKNRRMNRSKAFLEVGGRRIIDRILGALAPVCGEILLVTNTPGEYARLGLRVVQDILPHGVPLAGLHAGLVYSGARYNLVVACDMPFVSGSLARLLLERAAGFDAAVPVHGDGLLEPLCAVYGTTCVGPIERCLAEGKRRVVDFFPLVRVKYIGQAEVERVADPLLAFFNVNTPEDLERARELAR
jgi:molybdopterin-guanine dinucleotide biosynthesis protein A